MDAEFVRAALARENLAFGAFDGNHLISCGWRAFSASPHVDALWVNVEPPYHYSYKAFTWPSHRGRRIFSVVALFADSYLLERGQVAQVAIASVANFSSLAAQNAMGSRPIGYVGYVKCFGCVLPFRTPAAKKIGFRFARHRPRCDSERI